MIVLDHGKYLTKKDNPIFFLPFNSFYICRKWLRQNLRCSSVEWVLSVHTFSWAASRERRGSDKLGLCAPWSAYPALSSWPMDVTPARGNPSCLLSFKVTLAMLVLLPCRIDLKVIFHLATRKTCCGMALYWLCVPTWPESPSSTGQGSSLWTWLVPLP